MCSFLVYAIALMVRKKFNLDHVNFYQKLRGPDQTNIINFMNYVFIHNLLYITGQKTLQPFVNQELGVSVLFNGEIYNYKNFNTDYKSDGECLIPLYQKHGTDFVKELDGEFAIVLFDFNKELIVLSTDIFGTKPLWYQVDRPGSDSGSSPEIIVASYESAIKRIDNQYQPHKLEPNTILVLNLKTMKEIQRNEVYTFDLRQHKTTYDDWVTAFDNAILKRVTNLNHPIFVCLSSGYDSGVIVACLNKHGIKYKTYTIPFNEHRKTIDARLEINNKLECPAVVKKISKEEFAEGRRFLIKYCEPCHIKSMTGGIVSDVAKDDYFNVIYDWASVGLTIIFQMASNEDPARRIYLSGHGPDELFSDYGYQGKRFKMGSQFGGLFPNNLETIYPWRNFYHGLMECFLAKEEHVGGSLGIEGRYPFLDKDVVQEFLWLSSGLKNKYYKGCLLHYMKKCQYPIDNGRKLGFKVVSRYIRESVLEEETGIVANDKALNNEKAKKLHICRIRKDRIEEKKHKNKNKKKSDKSI